MELELAGIRTSRRKLVGDEDGWSWSWLKWEMAEVGRWLELKLAGVGAELELAKVQAGWHGFAAVLSEV